MIKLAMIILLLIVLIGCQVFLANKPIRWLGLVLPLITFLSSCILSALALFNASLVDISTIIMLVLLFFIYNTPTTLFLAIYFFTRHKYENIIVIKKKNFHDLD